MFDIQCFVIPDETFRPQLVSYQHAYNNFGHEIDWLAFIDGDEFLYPTESNNLQDVLINYSYEKLSALGVWWTLFGSSGHIKEPAGLIIENYQARAPLSFENNKHIKSIVRGHQGSHFSVGPNAHIFNTIYGTKDEKLRSIDTGYIPSLMPSWSNIRINHYVCQSLNYFKEFKQNSGSADAGASAIRSDEWWNIHNRNEEVDYTILRFSSDLKKLIEQIG